MMCEELHVSKSGFYNYLHYLKYPTIKEIRDQEDFKLIKQAYDFKNRKKGARQIKMILLDTFGIINESQKDSPSYEKVCLFLSYS